MNGPYIPKTDYTYPTKQDCHMITVKPAHTVDLSGDYPFRDKSFKFKLGQFFHRIFFHLIVVPVLYIRYAMKVDGKIDKKVADEGLITVCNHVFMWDNLAIQSGIRNRHFQFPIWRTNMQAPISKAYRYQGAIPVADLGRDGREAVLKFAEALNSVVEEKKWLHFYPETALWHYYVPIRKFKRTVFDIAVKHERPVVPLVFSFREPKGIYKLFKKKEPNVTLHIGEPVYPDMSLDIRKASDDLRERVHLAMVKMAGIGSEEENIKIMEQYNYREY